MTESIKAIITRPGETAEVVTLKRDDWVNEASRLMDGAHIEPRIIGPIVLLADEDSLRKGLEFNAAATSLAIVAGAPQCLQLVGPVIFTGPFKGEYPTDIME